jgi:hypothetical protein
MFLGLIVAWVVIGGPSRSFSREGVFLKPLAPLDTGRPYGGSYIEESPNKGKTEIEKPKNSINTGIIGEGVEALSEKLKNAESIAIPSLFSRVVVLDGVAGAKSTISNQEYLRLIAPDKNRRDVNISGLVLKSVITDFEVVIPKGVKTFIAGKTGDGETIALAPGQTALVSTGISPIGVSFRESVCTGYLGQFQNFTPTLRKDCPLPEEELKTAGLENDESCLDFVSTIPRCTVYTKTIPSNLSNTCKAFIQKNLTYNGCVIVHRDDSDFSKNTWRVFLGQTRELWRSNTEMIKLLDERGETVDALTY